VVAKVKERLAVSKEAAQKYDVERFNLRKLNEQEVRKQYQIEISNRFAALENIRVTEDINRTWENIKENIKTSVKESLDLYKLKQHKPWLDKECLRFLDQRKQAKMQWSQDPNQSKVDNLKNLRRESNRHCRNKKKEYLKAKIEELETNSKIKNIRHLCRGIYDFKKDFQSRTNIVENEKGDLDPDSHSTMAAWRKHFSQLFNAYGVSVVTQTELPSAEPLVPEMNALSLKCLLKN